MCVMSSKRFNRNRHLVDSQRAEEETLGFYFQVSFCVCKKMNKLKNDIMNTETKGAWKIG